MGMNGKEQYLTIKEFANYAQVSQQAIQQRTATSLKPYTKKVKGKKLINASALKEFYGVELVKEQDIDIIENSVGSGIDEQEQNQEKQVENFNKSDKTKSALRENESILQEKQEENKLLEYKVEYLEKLLEEKQKELDREIENNRFLKEQYQDLKENNKIYMDMIKSVQAKNLVEQTPEEPQEEKKSFFDRLLKK